MADSSIKRKASELAINATEETNLHPVLIAFIKRSDDRAERMEKMIADLSQKINEHKDQQSSFDRSLELFVQASDSEIEVEDEAEDDEEEISAEEESIVDESDKWSILFRQLREYRILNGDCNIQCRSKENPKLASFVKSQRLYYNNFKTRRGPESRKIKPERLVKLDSIGFNWGKRYPDPPTWDDMYEQTKDFQEKMGNCCVPFNSTNPNTLAKWAAYQRYEYKRFKNGRNTLITLDQIEKLKDIGFSWKGPTLW